jgi:8-oxo-dGTP pyrophosphatase MutT (NUDIX family)
MEQRHILSPGPSAGTRLTGSAIAERLAAAGRRRPPASDPGSDRVPVPAAVLVPLIERDGDLSVLFTRRAAHLVNHPGQISFPGGRMEIEDDGDRVVCALRETEEEIGLGRDRVTVIGRLDEYVTGTGFAITPVVGWTIAPDGLEPDPSEVAEIFEVPLAFLLDPANRARRTRDIGGQRRSYWEIAWGDRLIWGATAGILVNLSNVLAGRDG